MDTSYGLRSQADEDPNVLYAALPGTSAMGHIPVNSTAMKSLILPERNVPGCHPSRWIYELLNNNFTTSTLFERARQAQIDSPFSWDHQHRLVINGNQSFLTSATRTLSAICLDCHFHFVFRMAWAQEHSKDVCAADPKRTFWPPKDDQFPWHHLVWVGSGLEQNLEQQHTKYYPLVARESFACSAPPCTFQLTLEISQPRFGIELLRLIQDEGEILRNLNLARETDPARYENAQDEWAKQAPLNLNTYLKNILEAEPDQIRSISKRNKRFAVLFGPRCFSIFRQLEFTEEVKDVDGVDEGLFTPVYPQPPAGPSGTTQMDTYRAYLEDVRAEIQCLIHKAGQAAEQPTYCAPVLHGDLGCQEVVGVAENALVNVHRYKQLGVLPNQARQIVVNAYKRQWDLVPKARKDLVDCLMNIAADSGDQPLIDYAMTQSSVFDSHFERPTNNDDDGLTIQALEYLGLQPPNTYSGEQMIQAFRQKLARDPADADAARDMILVIARSSNDDSLQTMLLMESDAKMSLETAKAVLGITDVAPWEEMAKIFQSKVEAHPSEDARKVLVDALDAIADHTKDAILKQGTLELRQQKTIGSGSTSQPADLTLPVGLYNIGNTCYLNSLLQYLFTVKPVRDIVLNYDQVKLELDDTAIKQRRIGGNKMQMDRGEAVVAQAFVHELAALFQDLEASNMAASRPSQRLANAVLLSTHTLLHTPSQPSRAVSPMPPPLPARPSPAPPADPSDDVDMVNVSVSPIAEAEEARSNTSSQTLVDRDDGRTDLSLHKEDATMHESLEPEILLDSKEAADVPMQNGVASAPANVPIETNDIPALVAVEAPAEQSETVDEKVLRALEYQKRSSGTEQQDVEEVMGSIINRLQAAIRPTTVEENSGIQLERIMETFFVTTVNYTKKFSDSSYQSETSFDRCITAFPAPKGPCSLYEALGRNFNQQIIEESKLTRYTAIRTLPPVLHVLIQRSQSTGSKNDNPVVIPETLYLDRFMDTPHDSPAFKRRIEDWTLAARIDELKALLAKVKSEESSITSLERYIANPDVELPDEEPDWKPDEWDFDGPVEDDFLLLSRPPPPVQKPQEIVPPADIKTVQATMEAMMETELKTLEERLDALHEGMKENPYRLHAVICHRGHLLSGHYWVWIHDFKDNVWRWYNDSEVKVNNDTADVLKTLSTGGEPYYLCYVRDDSKDEYVDVPKRRVPQPAQPDEDGDVTLVDESTATATTASSVRSPIVGTPP